MTSGFTSLETATAEDWARTEDPAFRPQERDIVARGLLNMLQFQKDLPTFGWPITTYAHGLQVATRAFQAGEDEELVACALLHDIFDSIDLHSHGETIAGILKPYVSDVNHWLLAHHGIFQDYHAINNPARHSNAREAFRGHPAFEKTVLFCARYDENSFDPAFPTMPLEAFEPMVYRLIRNGAG